MAHPLRAIRPLRRLLPIVVAAATFAAAPFAAEPVAGPPIIDGVIDSQEWAAARREKLVGGGELLLLRAGTDLYVAVVGAATGFPTLCVGDGDRVEILHASAALGAVTYTRARGAATGAPAAEGRTADRWSRGAPFDWRVRETADGPAPQADRDRFFSDYRWLSTASRTGAPAREFRITLDPRRTRLGIVFLATDTMQAAHWPESMNDGCRNPELLRGAAPETLSFDPTRWSRID